MRFPLQNIEKNKTQTSSEAYLKRLCDKTFLSPWSIANPYKSPGKELCDLLVIFGDDVIIFSDKDCQFPNTGELKLDWSRWVTKTVFKSAEQAWTAVRWLRNYSGRVFLDAECHNPFPFNIPIPPVARYHVILVAHGASARCKKEFNGGSGSIMLNSDLKGSEHHTEPFVIGDLNPKKAFVHVLDDTTLDLVMDELDTVEDFVVYLKKKERLFRSSRTLFATGEEELLARYQLSKGDKDYDFGFPAEAGHMVLGEYDWDKYLNSPQRKARREADKNSYIWDQMIDNLYHKHGWLSLKFFTTLPSSSVDIESVIRIMASESRFRRRTLINGYLEILKTPHKDQRRVRCITSLHATGIYYIFLLFPQPSFISDEIYLTERMHLLKAYSIALKVKFPDARSIIGIANKSGAEINIRSEDVLYLDAQHWSKEQQDFAERSQAQSGLLESTIPKFFFDSEYPSADGRTRLETYMIDPRPADGAT